jgi:hypothetical protein
MTMMPLIILLPKVCSDEEKKIMATIAYPVKMLSSMCSLFKWLSS